MEYTIGQTTIYYEDYGTGKPVLCLHGFTEDHRAMTGCLEPIFQRTDGYRRIYLDLPGMGKSTSPEYVKNADDMLGVIKEFIFGIIGGENFLLVGESYGGYLSLGLLMQMKQRVDGVFLICSCVVSKHKDRNIPKKQTIIAEKNFIANNCYDENFEEFMEYAVIASEETFHRYKNEVLPGLQAADISFTEGYQNHGYGFIFENEINTLRFDKPACILTGRQDSCVGYADAFKLVDNFTRATFSVLDATGHNLQIENDKLFTALFIDWLERLNMICKE